MSPSEPVAPRGPASAPAPAPAAEGVPEVGARHTRGERWVEIFGRAELPTCHGVFTALACRSEAPGQEHLVLARGPIGGASAVPTRVHSECLTGDALGSLRCDCREQLAMSLARLGQAPAGLVLYLRQEGRGIGLGHKIRAYALQDTGLDTFAANRRLGFADDMRDWQLAAMLLALVGAKSVHLLTNNPAKVAGLAAHGTHVAAREPLVTAPNPFNRAYLRAKAERGGHLLAPP